MSVSPFVFALLGLSLRPSLRATLELAPVATSGMSRRGHEQENEAAHWMECRRRNNLI